jgi:Phage phiEco32-like COOH.NH2 ligase-type 2
MDLALRQSLGLGTDPEVFVRDSKGGILPSWKFLPKKGKALEIITHSIPFLSNGSYAFHDLYSVKAYTDGFQAEIALGSPTNCIATVGFGIRTGLEMILKAARTLDGGAKLTIENTPDIAQKVLDIESDEHVILGCSPSLNAYGVLGDLVYQPRKLRKRFSGGHIHIATVHAKRIYDYIRMCDRVLGVYFVGAAAGIDDPFRRKYYGLPGEHRLPKYGFEYRTLSNVWLCHPGIMHLAFNLMRGAIALVDAGMFDAFVCGDELSMETINNCDAAQARKIIKANEALFTAMLACGMGGENYTHLIGSSMLQVAYEGIESVVKNPDDIEKNWHLKKEWGKGGPTTWSETVSTL